MHRYFFSSVVALCVLTGAAVAQTTDAVPLTNWSAPLAWRATTAQEVAAWREAEGRNPRPLLTEPGGSAQLATLVAITPCRLVDTRQGGWAVPYGGGAWLPGSTYTIDGTSTASGQCSLPTALAYSANITVRMSYGGTLGYLTAWPAGTTQTTTANVTNIAGLMTVSNAAVIPAGTGGYANQFDIYLSANGTATKVDVIIDVNGYYISPTALALGAGAAAAPSLTFSTDTNTGLYSPSAGTIDITSAGTNALTINSEGISVNGGVRGEVTSSAGIGGLFLNDDASGKALSAKVGGAEILSADQNGVHAGPGMTGTPYAYGLFDPTGTLLVGSSNISCPWATVGTNYYFCTLTGVSSYLNSFVVVVTANVPSPLSGAVYLMTSGILVAFFDTSGYSRQTSFSIVVYKP